MTFGDHISKLATEAKKSGQHVNLSWIALLIDKELPKWRKSVKKAEVNPDAEEIFEAYPRHIAKDAAMIAISKVLTENEFEAVLTATRKFGAAVARWPKSYRYGADGIDRCPYPATWFNRGSYKDDPTEWTRIGGRELPEISKPYVTMPDAPKGWKEWVTANTNFDVAGHTWESLDPIHRQYITENMGK